MTLTEIQKVLNDIKELVGDEELAHITEDVRTNLAFSASSGSEGLLVS